MGIYSSFCNSTNTKSVNTPKVWVCILQQLNFSDRWLAWNAGTRDGGNTPQRVGETLRKAGVPYQTKWDIKDITSFDDFYKNPPTGLFKDARDDFLNVFNIQHEYVPSNEDAIIDALKFSPLGFSVFGFAFDNGLAYRPDGMRDNHWCLLYKHVKGQPYHIFDSYDNSLKELVPDYRPDVVKRYAINRAEEQTWLSRFIMSLYGR